jgi:chromosome segregation ATPase
MALVCYNRCVITPQQLELQKLTLENDIRLLEQKQETLLKELERTQNTVATALPAYKLEIIKLKQEIQGLTDHKSDLLVDTHALEQKKDKLEIDIAAYQSGQLSAMLTSIEKERELAEQALERAQSEEDVLLDLRDSVTLAQRDLMEKSKEIDQAAEKLDHKNAEVSRHVAELSQVLHTLEQAITTKQSINTDLDTNIKQKQKESDTLEDEIAKKRAILDDTIRKAEVSQRSVFHAIQNLQSQRDQLRHKEKEIADREKLLSDRQAAFRRSVIEIRKRGIEVNV